MNPRVTQVEAKAGSELLLTFTSGEQRRFSVMPYLDYPVYKPLQDDDLFQRVSVFNGTVCWGEGGEIDFDPDTLYLESVPLTQEV